MRSSAALLLAATLVACGGARATPTPQAPSTAVPVELPATRPAFVPPATPPPSPQSVGPAPDVVLPPTPSAPPAGADRARAEVGRVLTGEARDDMLSQLATAEGIGDEAQRYRAYVGTWQYMRDVYYERGERPEHRALLELVEAIARSFPQYQAAQFEVRRP